VTIKAKLLRGSDDLPELQRALVRKLAVAAMRAAGPLPPRPRHHADVAHEQDGSGHSGVAAKQTPRLLEVHVGPPSVILGDPHRRRSYAMDIPYARRFSGSSTRERHVRRHSMSVVG
jgi:hypothetical protein